MPPSHSALSSRIMKSWMVKQNSPTPKQLPTPAPTIPRQPKSSTFITATIIVCVSLKEAAFMAEKKIRAENGSAPHLERGQPLRSKGTKTASSPTFLKERFFKHTTSFLTRLN